MKVKHTLFGSENKYGICLCKNDHVYIYDVAPVCLCCTHDDNEREPTDLVCGGGLVCKGTGQLRQEFFLHHICLSTLKYIFILYIFLCEVG